MSLTRIRRNQRAVSVACALALAAAIALSIAQAREGDLVLLAGKGHEKTQTIAGRVIPFDDVAIAKQILQARDSSQ